MTSEQIRKARKVSKLLDRCVQSLQDSFGEKINVITMIMSADMDDDFNKVNMIGTEYRLRQMVTMLSEELKTENQKLNEQIDTFEITTPTNTNIKSALESVQKWEEVKEEPKSATPDSPLFSPLSLPKLPTREEKEKYGKI